MHVSDTNGCAAEDELFIQVERRSPVFVPNAFSPNGDNINDYFWFFINENKVAQISSLRIFDRWGGLVIEQLSAENDYRGWDGRSNGKECATGVYIYMAEVIYFDGKKDVISGEVVLMR